MILSRKFEGHYDPTNEFHDFRNFLFYVMTEVLDFGIPGEIQYDIADYMQNLPVSPDGICRGQAQAMRGCGKSVIACIFCTWLWYINPTIRIMTIASVASKAIEFGGLVKQILDSAELLEHLRPDPDSDFTMRHGKKIVSLKKQKNTETAFDVRGCGPSKDPSFSAYPVFGGWTGSHPDVIIPDDVEIPENSLTALKRGRLFKKLQECERLVMEDGLLMYMGTPQTEETIYTKLEEIGYPIRKWPAELVDPLDDVRAANVSPYLLNRVRDGEEPGDPSYHERFPSVRLIEAKAKGLAHYNLQMLLDTTLSDTHRYPLKLKNLIVMDSACDMAPANVVWGTAERLNIDCPGFQGDYLHAPAYVENEYQNFMQKVLYVDPKGGGADTVAYCAGGFLNGLIYLFEIGGYAAGSAGGTSQAVMTKLAKVAAQWEIKRVVVESNWGGSKSESAYAKLLQPELAKWNGPTQVDLNYVSGQKEKRIIDTLLPVTEQHRLIVSRQVAGHQQLMHQYTHITAERGSLAHEDELDAVYGVINEFIGMCNLDAEQRHLDIKEAAAVQTAKDFEMAYRRKVGVPMGEDPWKRKNAKKRTHSTKGRWGKC